MNELALFAGAGGGILAGHSLGWRTVCAVEWEPYAASVLAQRQNDKILAPFPIWDDVCTFDGKPWRGVVDVVSGGFPCTDISAAGRGAGIEGEHSGLWREMARIIGEVLPRFVFVENSPLLVGRGAAMVIGDLAAMGYDAQWCCLSASDMGAPHQRDRFWLAARQRELFPYADMRWNGRREQQQEGAQETAGSICHAAGAGLPQRAGKPMGRSGAQSELERSDCKVPDPTSIGQQGQGMPFNASDSTAYSGRKASYAIHDGERREWPPEPGICRVVDGMAARMDRLKALGNGQVPRVASTAWRILTHNA